MLGLVIGGALAPPVAGYLLKIMPTRLALGLVGLVSVGLTAVNFVHLLT